MDHAIQNCINYEEFIGNLKNIMNTKIFLNSDCKLVRVDALGMVLMKNFCSISWNGDPIIQRLFLKYSPYEFRRYLPHKTHNDCDQYFSSVWRQELSRVKIE